MECGACCQILRDVPGYIGCTAEEAVGLKVAETDTYRSLETVPIPGGFRCYALEGVKLEKVSGARSMRTDQQSVDL